MGGAPEGNLPLKARVLSLYGQLKLVVKPLPLIENILQNQLSAGNGANFSQGAVFQGEAAVGEVAHFQAIQGMILQIQDHVLAPCRVVACVHVSGQHVLRQVEGSAACQDSAAYLSVADSGSIHGVVCAVLAHQQRLLAARFPALPAVAVGLCIFMDAGVDRQGNGVGIDAVAAIGQGAVDLRGRQPGLVGHLGQLVTRIKIPQREGRLVEALQLGTILQLPLVGNVPGQAGGQFGSHLDFLIALPGIQLPFLASGGGILGLGGDGDGRAENGDGDGLGGQCVHVLGISDNELQLIGAPLHGVLGRDDYGLIAVFRKISSQTQVSTRPFDPKYTPVQILGRIGEGGRLIGSALIEVALLSLHREHGAGDLADVDSSKVPSSRILDRFLIADIHVRRFHVSLFRDQNIQFVNSGTIGVGIVHADAVVVAGGVERTTRRFQEGADNTGVFAAVSLQIAAIQFQIIDAYGVLLAAANLNGATLNGQGSASAGGGTSPGAVTEHRPGSCCRLCPPVPECRCPEWSGRSHSDSGADRT